MGAFRFGVLGPLVVWTADGRVVPVAERKVRMLLADLLIDPGRPVSVGQLIDDLWPVNPPGNPTNTLQTKVSNLRRALAEAQPGGGDLVVYQSGGYLLRVELDAVDTVQFRRLCAEARADPDPRGRADRLAAALRLWRGPALADAGAEQFAQGAIARLEEERLIAQEEQAEARLALGEHAPVAGELADLVAHHPLRERLRAAHIRALYGSGRQPEALASFQQLRRRLADDLGLEPGPDLAALHTAVLRQDPALRPRRADPPASGNLPVAPTELVGRTELVAEIGRQLTAHRLVTLAGPAGVGKTRLALAVAAAGPPPPGGAWLVELAALPPVPGGTRESADADPGDAGVADLVATVLGVRDTGPAGHTGLSLPEPAARIARALRDRELLLVADNCEHVIEPVAELLSRLLAAVPGLRVLATSREPLGVPGEVVWTVPPLRVPADPAAAGPPDLGAPPDPAAMVPRSSAVELFVARAAAAAPGFHLTAANAGAVAAICRRLDGIPLALELAASRVHAIDVHDLVELLADRFRLLASGRRGVPPRHRTLRATLDWSWNLLSGAEQAVLRRLAVPVEGCSMAAAVAVGAGDAVPAAEVPAIVGRLVDKSLLASEPGGGGRYRMLESVAAYGRDRLAETGELGRVRDRHLAYYLSLAERAEPELRGPSARYWLRRLDRETGNLRAAFAHAVSTAAGASALRLASALAWYWFLRGRLREAVRALAQARAVAGDAPPLVAARAGGWHAGLALLAGAPRVEPNQEVLARFEGAGDRPGRAQAEWLLALAELGFGELSASEALIQPAEQVFRELGDRWGVAAALSVRASQAIFRNDLPALRAYGEQSARIFAELGDGWGRLQALDALGVGSELEGDYPGGTRRYQEGLQLAEDLDLTPQVAAMLCRLGRFALLTGDFRRADELHERGRQLSAAVSHVAGEEYAALGLALSARRQGRFAEAEELLLHWLGWNRQVEARYGVALILAELGFVAEQRGDAAAAAGYHREGLAAARGTGDIRAVALALEGLAGAEVVAGRPEQAVELLGAAAAARRSVGAPLPPGERADVDRISAAARAALGDAEFRLALDRGGEQGAVAAAARVLSADSAVDRGSAAVTRLSD